MKNISLSELESLITERVLCDRLINPRTGQYRYQFKYSEALKQTSFATGDILIDQGLNKDFWARIRGKRIYLFYLPLNRIALEVGVITEKAENNKRKRLEIRFIGYRGKFPPETIADLIELLEESSRKYRERSIYGKNHQRKIR